MVIRILKEKKCNRTHERSNTRRKERTWPEWNDMKQNYEIKLLEYTRRQAGEQKRSLIDDKNAKTCFDRSCFCILEAWKEIIQL